jgi:hypothetical protein
MEQDLEGDGEPAIGHIEGAEPKVEVMTSQRKKSLLEAKALMKELGKDYASIDKELAEAATKEEDGWELATSTQNAVARYKKRLKGLPTLATKIDKLVEEKETAEAGFKDKMEKANTMHAEKMAKANAAHAEEMATWERQRAKCVDNYTTSIAEKRKEHAAESQRCSAETLKWGAAAEAMAELTPTTATVAAAPVLVASATTVPGPHTEEDFAKIFSQNPAFCAYLVAQMRAKEAEEVEEKERQRLQLSAMEVGEETAQQEKARLKSEEEKAERESLGNEEASAEKKAKTKET